MSGLRRRGRGMRIAKTTGWYVLLTVIAAITVAPVYITVLNSTLRFSDVLLTRFMPPNPFDPDTWSGIGHTYAEAWTTQNLGRFLLNSMVMTGCIIVGQVVTSVFAGYAFAFLRFPLKRTIFVAFLVTLMIPFEVTVLENLKFVSGIGLFNTYTGLALPFLATGFGAFLMRQAFLALPHDLWDAARLDGYGHLRFLWRVALPLVRPTVAALTVFAALSAWGQYLWPLLVTSGTNTNMWTVQIGVGNVVRQSATNINVAYAGLVIAMIPLLIVLVVFQKQLIRGLTAGAVKG